MVHQKSTSERIFEILNILFMILFALSILYPFFNILAISLNDSKDTLRGGITVFPRKLTWMNYQRVLQNPKVISGYVVTLSRTIIGTVLGLLCTSLFAYGMSKPWARGRRFYSVFAIIPMYISGGLIPNFILMKTLGLFDNFFVYIIPNLISIWNMILLRTYIKQLPIELEESALIDGAGQYKIFFRIILPLSMPIIATVALFNAVFHWNAWYDAAIYITQDHLKPIQSVLISIVNEARAAQEMSKLAQQGVDVSMQNLPNINERSLTMATLIITVLPIVFTYPFVQQYFTKGVLMGSLKG